MFNMGFQGQFGGGFIQGPKDTVTAGAGVTYNQSTSRLQPRDRSGRKGSYGIWVSSPHSGMNLHRRSR